MQKHVWITAAVVCTNILEEKDGSISLIRFADKLTINTQNLPEGMAPAVPIDMFIAVRGDQPGQHVLNLSLHSPSGQQGPITQEIVAKVEGPERGFNIKTRLVMPADEEGMYLIDVLLDKELFVRVPLQVVHQRENLTAE